MVEDKNRIIDILTKYFSKKDDVLLAYLFGSLAEDKVNPLSDIDIAVYFDKKYSKSSIARFVLDYTGELIELINFDKIDIVPINTAPPLLKYKIFRNPVIIKEVTESLHHIVKVRSLNEYFDFKPVLDMYAQKV